MCLGEMMGVGGGSLVALQSLSIMKKGTFPLNFQSNERFSHVSTTTKGHLNIFYQTHFGKNKKWMVGIHPPITLNL